ncbi:hypothetical protein D9M72_306980 [compost metagenome]
MDIAHGEGHVVEAGARLRQLQHEQVVVAALLRAAHEGATVRVAVGADEAEALGVEALAGVHVLDEEHHVADFDRLGALVDRTGLVDPALELPGVGLAALDLDIALASDLQAHRQSVGIKAADAALALDEAGVARDALGIQFEVRLTLHAPDHFAQGGAGLDGRRQAGLVQGRDNHAAAVEAFEDHLVVTRLHLLQAPVGKEAGTGGQVFHAVGDFVDSQYAHRVFLISGCRPRPAAVRSGPSRGSSAPCTGESPGAPSPGPGRCRASRRRGWRWRTACRC